MRARFVAGVVLVSSLCGAGWVPGAAAQTMACFHPDAELEMTSYGDVTENGNTNVVDALCVMIATLWTANPSGISEPACLGGDPMLADLTCDGTIEVADVNLCLTLAIGLPLSAVIDPEGRGCHQNCVPSCAQCPDGFPCVAGSGCESEVCAGASCAAPTCSDGVHNGDEEGVDCGGSCQPCLAGTWTTATEPRVVSMDAGANTATIGWEPLAGAVNYRIWRYSGANYARVEHLVTSQTSFIDDLALSSSSWRVDALDDLGRYIDLWRVDALNDVGGIIDFVNVRPSEEHVSAWATGTFADDFSDGTIHSVYVNRKPAQVTEANGYLQLTQTVTDERSRFYLPYDAEGKRYIHITADVMQYRNGTQPWSGGIKLNDHQNTWKSLNFHSPWESYMGFYGADLRYSHYRADLPAESAATRIDLDQVARWSVWYDYELLIDTQTGDVSGQIQGNAYASQLPHTTGFVTNGRILILFDPFGYYTGHYIRVDNLTVESYD